MNNKALIPTILIAIILIVGGFVLVNNDSDTSKTNTNSESESVAIVESDNSNSSEMENKRLGSFVDFSEEQLVATADTQQVVFFHAEWCSTCRFYEKQIETSGVPEGVTILKADYDEDKELKERYGVTVQSTCVLLDDNGEVERTWPFAQGLRGIDDLYSEII